MGFVKALNEIHSNILSLLIIIGGVVLCKCNDSATGRDLIILGASIFRQSVGTNESTVVK
jgi:hypothetical protein